MRLPVEKGGKFEETVEMERAISLSCCVFKFTAFLCCPEFEAQRMADRGSSAMTRQVRRACQG